MIRDTFIGSHSFRPLHMVSSGVHIVRDRARGCWTIESRRLGYTHTTTNYWTGQRWSAFRLNAVLLHEHQLGSQVDAAVQALKGGR